MASADLKVRRCVAGQVGGRMLTEIEATDQPTLEKWFAKHRINCEWVMRIDLDASGGTVEER